MKNGKICVTVACLLVLSNDFRFYSNGNRSSACSRARARAISCLKQMRMFLPRFFALSRWNYRIHKRLLVISISLEMKLYSFQIELSVAQTEYERKNYPRSQAVLEPHQINTFLLMSIEERSGKKVFVEPEKKRWKYTEYYNDTFFRFIGGAIKMDHIGDTSKAENSNQQIIFGFWWGAKQRREREREAKKNIPIVVSHTMLRERTTNTTATTARRWTVNDEKVKLIDLNTA